MHAVKLLHDLFDKACSSVDKRIRKTLFSATEALTRCKQLSISGLGRSLNRPAKIKHTIKCIDRLFGNPTLHEKRTIFYKNIVHLLLKDNRRPAIIVDWSGLTPCGAFHFLSASVVAKGRSLTLYDQVYPLKEYSSEKTHLEFLRTLQTLLPINCKPIIITDAGFRNTWFRAVSQIGWDFVGRVRNKTKYCIFNQNVWLPIKNLYEEATEKARYIGRVLLAYSSQFDCHFYLMRQKNKNRIKRNLVGKKVRCSSSLKHAKSAKEPWLIASSLSPEECSVADIMMLYKKRMQIEEVFRDLKNTRNGFGLRHCRSFKVERLNVALLIGALGMLVLWIFGISAKKQNLHFSFQANTIRSRNVLSNFMIGWQALTLKSFTFSKNELIAALELIVSLIGSGELLC